MYKDPPTDTPTEGDLTPLLLRLLRGELSTGERDDLEERALTDPDLFEGLEASESEILDSWARGELPPEAARDLTELLGATTGGRARMAFAAALHQHLEARNDAPAAPGVLPFLKPDSPAPAPSRRPGLLTWGALAASLALAVLCLWLLASRGELARQLAERPPEIAAAIPPQPQPSGEDVDDGAVAAELDALNEALESARERGEQASAQVASLESELAELRRTLERSQRAEATTGPRGRVPFVLTFAATVRTLDEPHQLALRPADEVAALTVDLGDDHGYRAYRAALRTARGAEIWSVGELAEAETAWGKTVTVEVPADRLESGDYELILLGFRAGEAEEVGFYPFRVARGAAESSSR